MLDAAPQTVVREGLFAGHLRRSSFMATSKNRRAFFLAGFIVLLSFGVFGFVKKKRQFVSHTGKSWKFDNSKYWLPACFHQD
jgi:LPXTG-motif cell wall-anchored protein